ncbi:ALA-interacting subunit 1 isoform X2 [Physcomitrium patens]|uniref:ALA-interacting subunit n=2 Tax=Physcomitrium patens TaxID=3218 RepID=A9SY77_PHYPA|nr:ALA-interacting subunit 1-like [Physcomitrium patens]PNR50654.1 hypothetical protein PHYPA_009840 [Physcomitrium patens]|eukprot:XP_024380417.1 ALA-interacting subunit 1-like [Physcomitrella patens]
MAIGGGDFLRRLQKEEVAQQRLSRISRRPKYTKFSQQELGSWKPLPTPRCIVFLFVFLGVACLPVGFYTLHASWSIVELVFRYDVFCIMNYATAVNPLLTNQDKSDFMQDFDKRKNCTVTMNVEKLMRQPIYVYYELGNYFQNHRRYMNSKSEQQLRGFSSSSSSSSSSHSDLDCCKPKDVANGHSIVPCGLVAWSLFNDTFDISTNGFYSDNGTVFINQTWISWRSDREERFNGTVFPSNFINNNRSTVADVPQIGGAALNYSKPLSMDENLVVWMRTAALPTVRKLYGRIETDLRPGTQLMVRIENLYNTYGFGGSKKLVLSTTSWIGGRNDFLGLSYLVVGCVSIFVGFVFGIAYWRRPRPLGDRLHLSWVKNNLTPSAAASFVTDD